MPPKTIFDFSGGLFHLAEWAVSLKEGRLPHSVHTPLLAGIRSTDLNNLGSNIMNYVRFVFVLVLVLVLGIPFAGAPAQAQTAEIEPNSSCLSAQPLGALPATVAGSLDTPPDTPDVDYYRITATPGDLVQIEQRGSSSGSGTLADPFVGAFDSACVFLGYDDDGGTHLDSRLELTVPADGILVIAASTIWDWDFSGNGYYSGTYTLAVSRVAVAKGIGGRVVNASTGAAIPSAFVGLMICDDNGSCWQYAGYTYTAADGTFRFEPGNYTLMEDKLRVGEYRLTVSAGPLYQFYESTPFQILEGQDLDFGDIGVQPVPVVGSIRGRLVDAVTGEGMPGDAVPFARVELQSCPTVYGGWCWTVRYANADAQGNFVFESSQNHPLSPGKYRVVAFADQYEETAGSHFDVAADQHLDVGDLAVKSFPVRLNLVSACSSVPVTGGSCAYEVRVSNGNSSALKGSIWSLVQSVPRYWWADFKATEFQAGSTKNVTLSPGASVDLSFSFTVPASLRDGTAICASAYTSEKNNPFETIGTQNLFCVYKTGQGTQVMPDAEKRELMKKIK